MIFTNKTRSSETRFDTSNFEIDRPLPKGKNKKVIGLIKDELGGQIMKEFIGLKEKHIAILKTTTMKVKKQKAQKVCQNFKILKAV